MTEHTSKPSSAKKGMAVIGWILMIAFFVGISMLIINWVQSRGTALAEETVKYVESRMDCEPIRLANISTNCAAKTVELKNIGTLNIIKVSAQLDDKRSKTISIDIKAQAASQQLNIGEAFKKARIIPIIQSNKDMIGCKEKSVTVYCP